MGNRTGSVKGDPWAPVARRRMDSG